MWLSTWANDEEYNQIMSYFNEHTWKNFIMKPRPQQQVFTSGKVDERVQTQNVDIIRCRKRAMTGDLAAFPWCVFSIWDDIYTRANCKLADFNFVSTAAQVLQPLVKR